MKTNILLIVALLFSVSIFAQKTENKEPEKAEKQGIIIFKSLEYDFGTIEYGAEAKAIFVFKNTTKKPVKLTNVKTSCGCTAADWPREEIAKKKKGKISVTYDSKRVGKFTKTINVSVEGVDNPIQLTIKGEVLPQAAEGSTTESQKTDSNGSSNIKTTDNQKNVNSDGVQKVEIQKSGPSSMDKPVTKKYEGEPKINTTDEKTKKSN